MSSSDQKSPGFTVTDRRAFAGATDSTAKPADDSTSSAPGAGSTTTTTSAAPPPEAPAKAGPSAPSATKLPPVDFVTFAMSLASAVVLDLGEAPHPDTGKAEKNLPMAKHTIDILSMLQEKTRSNLTTQEAGVLETLLYDLRLRYVAATKS